MSSNVVSLGQKRQEKEESELSWFNASALCLACKTRWIATISEQTALFQLECPSCKCTESFASVLPQEYMDHFEVNQ